MSNQQTKKPISPRRVVITGIGAVTPLGNSLQETWNRALEGKSGIANITRFNTDAYDVHFGGEVKGFNPDLYVPKKEQKKMDLFIQYSMAAAKMAIESSGIELTEEVKNSCGIFIGSGMGGLPGIEEEYKKVLERGPGRISPFFIPAVITNLASGQVSIQHGLKGPNYSITSACATGAHSIGEAYNYIRFGMCDYMVAGGAESTVCPLGLGGFAAMRALSTRNDNPQAASRPFDKDRDGFVMGEGSAIFMMETLESAQKRGAKIICEVSGYGASSDAHHITNPAPEGEGGGRAMTMALRDAGLNIEDIGYINAHGTSTPVGDELETAGIKSIFKHHAKKLWISSTKSMTGHTLGAAGAIEGAFCAMAVSEQVVPPTINLDNPSDNCDLDYVPKTARHAQNNNLRHVMNNSFGFGGTNACLIFSKV